MVLSCGAQTPGIAFARYVWYRTLASMRSVVVWKESVPMLGQAYGIPSLTVPVFGLCQAFAPNVFPFRKDKRQLFARPGVGVRGCVTWNTLVSSA